MSQIFRVVTRNVSESITTTVSEEQLQKIFSLVDADKSVEEIIASGVLESEQTSTLLLKLIAEKAVEPVTRGESRPPIILMTDSASDLPPEIIKEKKIVVIPLNIEIDGELYRDGVDLSSEKFYQLLRNSKSFPKTSPPSQQDFERLYSDYIGHSDILGIFISRRMSKTCDLAKQAIASNYNVYLKKRISNPEMPKRFRIETVDSSQVSMGTGLLVLEALDRIEAGWSLDEVKTHIEKMASVVQVFFMVDNLDYLARGGRIGRGSAFLGNLFGFKPILGMAGGGVDAKSRSFGGKRGQRKLIEYMKKELTGVSSGFRVGICHANAPEKAAVVRDMINDAFPGQSQTISSFGPIVGAHLGPGAVGVAWLVG